MRLVIFAEAIKNQVHLEEVGTSRNKTMFQYNFPNKEYILVDLIVEDNKTLLSCSCKHHSLHKEALCQYTLGVIFFLFKKQLKRLKQKW